MSSEPEESRRRVRVTAHEAGTRLDKFLASRFPRWSRKKLARVVEEGSVRVSGRKARPGTILGPEDVVEVPALGPEVDRTERERSKRTRAVRTPVEVVEVHRDADLLVVVKPPGMPVHGGAELGAVRTLLETLRVDVIGGYGLVHRLDRDTSGLIALVHGEEQRAATAARFADEAGGISKVYEAIVQGVPDPPAGTIDLPLSPPGHGGKARVDMRGGKSSVSEYRTLEVFEGASRVSVEPKTGRTHQIRVHLAAVGNPLLVDRLYGSAGGWRLTDPRGRLDARLRRTPLHASELTLPHPRTGEPLTFRAPLPPDMRYALEVLRVVAGRRRTEP